jgi:hypothetical protein
MFTEFQFYSLKIYSIIIYWTLNETDYHKQEFEIGTWVVFQYLITPVLWAWKKEHFTEELWNLSL